MSPVHRLVAFVALSLASASANGAPLDDVASDSSSPALDRGTDEQPKKARRGLGVRTDVPVFVGPYAFVEHAPTRLRLLGGVGVLPGAYARMANDLLSGAGAYDERISAALDETLTSSLSAQLRAGFRPFSNSGFLLEGGYSFARLTASGPALQTLQVAAGVDVPALDRFDADFDLRSSLHMLDARIGWEWALGEHVLLTSYAGISYIASASTSVEQRYIGRAPARARAAIDEGAERLDESFTRYGFIPVVGLGVAYRF